MCHRCDQKNNDQQNSKQDPGKRSFLKLTAVSTIGLGFAGSGIAAAQEKKAAIDAVDHHKDFSGHIQLLASAIAPAVRAVSDTSSSRLINVTKKNVIMTVERLKNKTPILDYYHDQKKLRVVGRLYHLDTGRVELIA